MVFVFCSFVFSVEMKMQKKHTIQNQRILLGRLFVVLWVCVWFFLSSFKKMQAEPQKQKNVYGHYENDKRAGTCWSSFACFAGVFHETNNTKHKHKYEKY